MAHIKEPDGIDFVVESKPLSDSERKQISEIIEHYKATGRKMKLPITISRRKKYERTTSSLTKAGRKTIN